jgi:leader peptidase (prepilin peptidase)/N-methyltransferase
VSELPAAVRLALYAWVALAGAAIGSFLNVVIARVPAGESVVRPRSRCPRCGAGIAWYDNVPVVSWLVLRARCRGCGARISARYPLVELLGAGAALLAVARHGPSLAAAVELAFVALLVALAFIDLDTWLLPHALTWPTIALGLVASAGGAAAAPGLASSAWGAGAGFAAFAAVALLGEKVLKKEAMGWGDVWLLAGLGAFLGIGAVLPVVLLASIQGAVVGVALIVLGKAQKGPPAGSAPAAAEGDARSAEDDWVPPRNAVPFGPFLVAAALEWLYLGDAVARAVPALEIFR